MRRAAGLALLVTVAFTTAHALAGGQRFGRRRPRGPAPALDGTANMPYDGMFTFVRLRYRMDGLETGFGRGGWGLPPWAHDYPRADRNFMKILDEITGIAPFLGASGGNILTLDDPELCKYPLAYMSEPGFWTLTEDEALGLRRYLQKGGFVIFDDFRGRHWDNFAARLHEVLPAAQLVELEVTNPIFHSFFDVASLDFVQFYDRGRRAIFYGVYEDNDPSKRLMLIANYNNDIGEYWEYSDSGFTPIELSNEAYKLGVNYVIYSMTH